MKQPRAMNLHGNEMSGYAEGGSPADPEFLLGRIQSNDQAALMALYQQYANLVFSMALRVLHRQTLAEEVTQDVFLKIWRQPQRWNPEMGRFSSWLLAVTRNSAIDRLRKEGRQPQILDPPLEEAANSMPALESVGDPAWHEGQELRRLLTRLPPEQRDLIELAFFGGYTHSELAEGLGLPLGTVKTRLRTGLHKLKALWDEAHAVGQAHSVG